MRNLTLLQQTFQTLPLEFIESNDVVVGYAAVDKNTYFGITKNGVLFSVDMFDYESKLRANLKIDFEGVVNAEADLLAIQFVSELESLCIVSNVGNIVTYKVLTDEVCVCCC